MKRILHLVILVALVATMPVVSGCAMYGVRDPNHSFKYTFRTYERSRDMKILAPRGRYYSDIGFNDLKNPRSPYTLLSSSTELRIQAGRPAKFVGRVLYVHVWLDDVGPIQARMREDGDYYITISTKRKSFVNTKPVFGNISPGLHTLTVCTGWEQYRGPYERGSGAADVSTTLFAWIDFDPNFVRTR